MAQDQLFDLRGQAIRSARDAVRRAKERNLTAVPEPSLFPTGPRPLSVRERTIGAVPRGSIAEPMPSHGTRARYNHKRLPCRCPRCCHANTEYIRSYRHRDRPGNTPALIGRNVTDVDVTGRVL